VLLVSLCAAGQAGPASEAGLPALASAAARATAQHVLPTVGVAAAFTTTVLNAADAERQAWAWLTPDERELAARIVHGPSRCSAALARALLRLMCGEVTGNDPRRIGFSRGRHGKPRLVPSGVPAAPEFSVAHCDGAVAIVLAARPVGIDVERVREDLDVQGIAARLYSPCERAEVSDSETVAAARKRFFRTWARKEALIKAAGLRLDDAASFDSRAGVVSLADETGLIRRYAVDPLPAPPGLVCALALASLPRRRTA
jgi:4'-phosphopantetheinyl transferase